MLEPKTRQVARTHFAKNVVIESEYQYNRLGTGIMVVIVPIIFMEMQQVAQHNIVSKLRHTYRVTVDLLVQ